MRTNWISYTYPFCCLHFSDLHSPCCNLRPGNQNQSPLPLLNMAPTGVLVFLFLPCVMKMVFSASLATTAPPGCVFQGQWFLEGHQFRPDPCTFCRCSNGMSMCLAADCAPPSCVDFVQDPNQCCASCPNGRQLVLLFLPALILSGNQGSEAAGLSFFLS